MEARGAPSAPLAAMEPRGEPSAASSAAPHPSAILTPLKPGKHPELRCAVEGTVVPNTVKPLSQRLVFFSLAEDGGQAWECIAKDRDGHLTAMQISELAIQLQQPGVRWRIVAFPERGQADTASLHCVSVAEAAGGAVAFGGADAAVVCEPAETPAADVPIVQWKHSGNHVRPNNAARHQHFVSWLVETYGIERLRSGAGVLDVAGGAGGTSFELAFRRGVPCTVVDPRPIKATAKQGRAMRCRAQVPAAARGGDRQRDGGDEAEECEEEEGEEQEAAAAADNAPPPPLAPAGEEAPVAPALARAAEEAGLAAGSTCLPRQLLELFDADFVARHARLWRDCSVVIGMHPDEATEPVVELALAAGKPFAVVPCCVFPESNPHRVCADGTPVRLHPEYCRYLEERGRALAAPPASLAVEATTLWKLPGRNAVVYAGPKGRG